jgi:phosphoribosylglycinamide formyltransferase-1
MKKKIAIFASGGGSNAESIIKHFKSNEKISIDLVLSNKSLARVLSIAHANGIPSFVFSKKDFYESNIIIAELKSRNIDFVILAGFLLKVPSELISAYSSKILNIHPSLLPKYGGEGMYGHYVHEAVKTSDDQFSGMTIHLVNEEYDKGKVLFQASTRLEKQDNSLDIAQKVLLLEHYHYPKVIEKFILSGAH